jgi:hypothetical protein
VITGNGRIRRELVKEAENVVAKERFEETVEQWQIRLEQNRERT